jgi:hypothetical protein
MSNTKFIDRLWHPDAVSVIVTFKAGTRGGESSFPVDEIRRMFEPEPISDPPTNVATKRERSECGEPLEYENSNICEKCLEKILKDTEVYDG